MEMEAGAPRREADIISVLDIPSPDPTRLGKMDVMVTYRVDPMHSFTIRLPKENSSKAEIEAAIRKDWATRKEVIGAKITL